MFQVDEILLTLQLLGITISTDLRDRLRSGKKVTSLKKRKMAHDVPDFISRDEMVYGRLYVTSFMAAIESSNNTRITLDAQISCLIRHHACACSLSASLQAMLSCFCPPPCHLKQVWRVVVHDAEPSWTHDMWSASFVHAVRSELKGAFRIVNTTVCRYCVWPAVRQSSDRQASVAWLPSALHVHARICSICFQVCWSAGLVLKSSSS